MRPCWQLWELQEAFCPLPSCLLLDAKQELSASAPSAPSLLGATSVF